MAETAASISAWIDATFGTEATHSRFARRAGEEMCELIVAIDDSATPTEKVREECADVAIVLCGLCARLGGDLWDEIERKMAINRSRKWAMDGTGCGYHIKETETA